MRAAKGRPYEAGRVRKRRLRQALLCRSAVCFRGPFLFSLLTEEPVSDRLFCYVNYIMFTVLLAHLISMTVCIRSSALTLGLW